MFWLLFSESMKASTTERVLHVDCKCAACIAGVLQTQQACYAVHSRCPMRFPVPMCSSSHHLKPLASSFGTHLHVHSSLPTPSHCAIAVWVPTTQCPTPTPSAMQTPAAG